HPAPPAQGLVFAIAEIGSVPRRDRFSSAPRSVRLNGRRALAVENRGGRTTIRTIRERFAA
ncbi:hypothetical protein, partial [Actinomyces gerencseriae]|uniref:hypothetical protein n=1 Tax=Actinomyces gerencseriae TaxID=52769 RepID=UPI0023F4FEE3